MHTQVKKAYGTDMQGIEAHEEMARMREHVLSEVCGCVCVCVWVCVWVCVCVWSLPLHPPTSFPPGGQGQEWTGVFAGVPAVHGGQGL